MWRGIRRGFARDPLLKFGVAAMALALAFAGAVAFFSFLEGSQRADAARNSPAKMTGQQLVRSDPGVDPSVEGDKPSVEGDKTSSRSARASASAQDGSALPLDENGYPLPTDAQVASTEQPRRYHLPRGAIMALTIPSIGLRNVPVMDSVTTRALDRGVVHLPETSLPWSDTPERNVYLAGHRLGWPGTGSHLIFYRLDELEEGDRITLRGREGTRYVYRVLESFKVRPDENWVTGRVRDRDLLTLQTCTPIPTFQWRLIVRAERI
jgi:sortase A